MSLSSISHQLPRVEQQNMEHRIRSSVADCSSVFKVIAVAASAFITIAAFVLGGPITGIIVALLCGVSLNAVFNGSIPSPNARWLLSGNPPGRGFDPHHPHGHGHVPHGQGHGNPHVPGHVVVGGGHFRGPGAPPQHGHVPVGAHPPVHGHAPAGGGHPPLHGHAPVGGHPPAHGHAPVGGGHHRGAGPTEAPPPSGPGGHVPVGGGRRG